MARRKLQRPDRSQYESGGLIRQKAKWAAKLAEGGEKSWWGLRIFWWIKQWHRMDCRLVFEAKSPKVYRRYSNQATNVSQGFKAVLS